MWAEEHALNIARFEYEKSAGNMDRAYRAYAGTLGLWERVAEMYGFVPNLNLDQAYAGMQGGAAAGGGGGFQTVNGGRSVQQMRSELVAAGGDQQWNTVPDDQVISEYAKVTGGAVTPTGGATAGAGGQFSFLQALQNTPTLEARRFMLEARARPDILGSIRAESGLPYGVQGTTAGLPGAEGMQPYYGGAFPAGNRSVPAPVNSPLPEGEPIYSAWGNQGFQPGPGYDPAMAQDPRFQEFVNTPFVQAVQGYYQGQQGSGSDAALALPSVNQIPFTWYNQQSPDVQAATKGLYPGLTTQGFLQPFVQAISSLGRNTGTRYA